jgi:hypothetical protein
MPDKRKADDRLAPDQSRVEVIAQFRHDGVYVQPGATLVMTTRDAEDLAAMNFVRPYRRRDMRADR